MNLTRRHALMLLKYSGISFISGAVNHGFFSGQRSLLTAATGIVLFVAGALWEHRIAGPRDCEGPAATLLWGTLLSIGLGFFTGGLQHFPDSPDRSAWVVPVGYAVSAIALAMQLPLRSSRPAWAASAALGAAVVVGSLSAAQYLLRQPGAGHEVAHSHGGEPAAPAGAVPRTVVVSMGDDMRYDPSAIDVRAGEVVRVVAQNDGKLTHELIVGTEAQLREHAQAMQSGAAHSHSHTPTRAAGVSVPPAQSGEFTVKFDKAQALQIACLVPGHYEAGMRGNLNVAGAGEARGHSGHKHN